MEYDVTKCAFMAPDPKLMTVDFSEIAKDANQHREEMAKLNPPKPEPVRAQYNRLRQQLYELQQAAKNAEIFATTKADTVAGLEQRIEILLKEKKKATEEGHLGQERWAEHNIQLLEAELIDAKGEATSAKSLSAGATRKLREFDHAQLAELKKACA